MRRHGSRLRQRIARCGSRALAASQFVKFNRGEVSGIIQQKLRNRLEGTEYNAETAAAVRPPNQGCDARRALAARTGAHAACVAAPRAHAACDAMRRALALAAGRPRQLRCARAQALTAAALPPLSR